MGVLWADSAFPHHAPPDQRLLRAFLGGVRTPDVISRSNDELVATAVKAMRETLDIRGEPTLVDICPYPDAIPQYYLGHGQRIAQLRKFVAAIPWPAPGRQLSRRRIDQRLRSRRQANRARRARRKRIRSSIMKPQVDELPRPERRPRRLRRTPVIRGLVRETRLTPDRLVLPLFVLDGENRFEPIASMPGHARQSIDLAIKICREALSLGVGSFALFPAIDPKKKTADAAEAVNPDNLLCRTVRMLREAVPAACLITDIALDPYSRLGHDGLVGQRGDILNDETVDVLAQMAVLHAEAGADIVAPSDMMDGRVGAIRAALDNAGALDTSIISYTAKYASAYYGPFRDALESAPVDMPNVPKDKKTYQMDPANAREAITEVELDELEGADMLMVKPAPALSRRHLPRARSNQSTRRGVQRQRRIRNDQSRGAERLAR